MREYWMADNKPVGNVRAERLDIERETAKMLYLVKGNYKKLSGYMSQVNKDDPRLFPSAVEALDALAARLTGEESLLLARYRSVRADRERAEKMARQAREGAEVDDA